MRRSFDPNTLTPLDSLGTVYPTGAFDASWGSLEVSSGGALLTGDFQTLRVAAPAAGEPTTGTVKGDGWTLTLKEGWAIQPIEGGRAGDSLVAKQKSR
jgi:hypothetical protein